MSHNVFYLFPPPPPPPADVFVRRWLCRAVRVTRSGPKREEEGGREEGDSGEEEEREMWGLVTRLGGLVSCDVSGFSAFIVRSYGKKSPVCFADPKASKPEMVNAPEGLNTVILRKIKRFDCQTNQVSSKQLASS